jgi:Nitroreductase
MFKSLVAKNRSYRRFDESQQINKDTLTDIIDIARICSSAANMQGMRYRVVSDKINNKKVFDTLGWAGYLKEWNGPKEGERPTAYIVVLRDRFITDKLKIDDGIVAQTITLAATEKGYGACILSNCKWKELFKSLELSEEKFAFSCVIALGVPSEIVLLEDVINGDIKYYRDEMEIHHVPKRSLEDLLV